MLTNNNPIILAQSDYTLLETSTVSGLTSDKGTVSFTQYIKGAYVTLFMVIIIAAIIMLVVHGLKYMLTDVPSIKIKTRFSLQSVIWGLVIALSSFILLELINPDLIRFTGDLFK